MAGREIILASQSPRRRELLSKMGYEFICDAADVDEHVQGQAREIVGVLARRKAHAVKVFTDEVRRASVDRAVPAPAWAASHDRNTGSDRARSPAPGLRSAR